jgi:hypothetical protein
MLSEQRSKGVEGMHTFKLSLFAEPGLPTDEPRMDPAEARLFVKPPRLSPKLAMGAAVEKDTKPDRRAKMTDEVRMLMILRLRL